MKYSIDVNTSDKIVSGWAATENGLDILDGMVFLQNIESTLEITPLSVQRDDVKNANLHHNGKCGFVFKGNTQTNRIYNVAIKSKNEEVNKTIFMGDLQPALTEFSSFEVNRDDISIMEPSTEDLQRSNGDLLLIKKLLIRLRRNKRAKNFRGKFIGINYEHKENDWALFDKLIKNYRDFLLEKIETRYLWSFIDTYADFGNPYEKLAALAVSNILNCERFAQTLHCIYDLKPKAPPVKDTQLRYWDGMGTNLLKADDSYDVFLTRNLEVLATAPLIKFFFKEYFRRSIKHSDSINRLNIDNSKHFEGTFAFYNENLKTL